MLAIATHCSGNEETLAECESGQPSSSCTFDWAVQLDCGTCTLFFIV